MALITASEARVYIPTLSDGEDTKLGTLIAIADNVLAGLCGIPPYSGQTRTLEDQTYTLYLDGPGGRELYLPVRPIVSITSIYDDPLLAYGASTAVDSGDWTAYNAEGLLILDADATHGAWSTSPRALKVTAVLGYATIPDAIKHACGLLVAHWWRNVIPSLGKESISTQGSTVTLATAPIPRDVRMAMAPFVLWSGLL
jgi:hypothetical protein